MLSHTPPPSAPGVTEEVLAGARALRRAFLAAPLRIAARGTSIIHEPTLCLVRRGFVLRCHDLANGSRAIVDVLIPGDIVGLDHVLIARPIGDFTVASQLSYQALKSADVRNMIKADANVSFHVLAKLTEAHWRIEQFVTAVMRLEARERLAAFIIGIYQRLRRHGLISGMSFYLPMTQEEIADHLGLTIVHVSRTLRRLREEGLVIVDRHVVMIRNYQGLRDLLSGLSEPAYMPSPMLDPSK